MDGKYSRLWLFGWAIFALSTATYLVFFANFSTEISDFVPQPNNVTREITSSALEGPGSRIWMLSISGPSATVLAQLSQQFADKLRDTGRFVRVQNGVGDDDPRLQTLLFKYRYFLDRRLSTNYFSVDQLRADLLNRLSELSSPLSSITQTWLTRDPTGSYVWFLEEIDKALPKPVTHLGVWFSSDKANALLFAETEAPAMALDDQENIRMTVNATFNELNSQNDVKLTLAGVPNIALETRSEIKSESQRLSLLASCAVLVLLWFFYRSPRTLLIATIPLLGGMLAGSLASSLIFGSIHGIVLAFGATLLGVAVDYPVHLFSHTLARQRLQDAATRIWPTLRLGVITTLLGYMALVGSSVPGLAQLGVFSVSGILAAAWITRTLLPTLSGQIKTTPLPDRLSNLLLARPHLSMRALGIALTIISSIYLAQKQEIWSSDIANLSSLTPSVRQQHTQMQRALGISDSLHYIGVTANNEADVLQRSEEILPLLADALDGGEILGFEATALILPSPHTQTLRQQAVPKNDVLNDRLTRAAHGLPFAPNIFEPFLADIQQFRDEPQLTRTNIEETQIGETFLRLLTSTTTGSYAMIPLSGVKNPNKLREQINQAGITGVEFVDIKEETNSGLRYLRDEALNRIALALLVIVVVLGFGLRDIGRLTRVTGAVACALITATAATTLIHGAINLFHLVSLLLVVGIGIDYGLFFSRSPHGDDSRRNVHGVVVCFLSTFAVFAILASASIPVLQHIGTTVAIGVAASFFYAALFSRSQILLKPTL